MASRRLPHLPAVLKQRLLVEFAGLKQASPQGVFVSLTPGDPTLWSGVIFVRKGPYAPSVLRFQISFSPGYPSQPPLITFSTDIFHPLVSPLTTYMHTTGAAPQGTVSAADAERLPPGGFSLREGFPAWFGRTGGAVQMPATYDVLRYVRSVFDDAAVLDRVPLGAAGNPGAWHAWRCHRVKEGVVFPASAVGEEETDGGSDDEESVSSRGGVPEGYQRVAGGSTTPMASRRPGEWNWDGVWEIRVKKGTEGSLAEGTLFGREAGDDLIRFLNVDAGECERVKAELKQSLESVAPQRRGVV